MTFIKLDDHKFEIADLLIRL